MTPQQIERNRLLLSKGLLILGLLLMGALASSGCVSSPRTVNVSERAGLAQASQLEIAELVIEPQAHYEHRLTVTDPSALRQLNAALDADLRLGPLVDCLAKYRLSFVLAGGEVQTLDYYCASGESFLTGAQAFWSGQLVKPPAEFDAAVSSLLQTLSN